MTLHGGQQLRITNIFELRKNRRITSWSGLSRFTPSQHLQGDVSFKYLRNSRENSLRKVHLRTNAPFARLWREVHSVQAPDARGTRTNTGAIPAAHSCLIEGCGQWVVWILSCVGSTDSHSESLFFFLNTSGASEEIPSQVLSDPF